MSDTTQHHPNEKVVAYWLECPCSIGVVARALAQNGQAPLARTICRSVVPDYAWPQLEQWLIYTTQEAD